MISFNSLYLHSTKKRCSFLISAKTRNRGDIEMFEIWPPKRMFMISYSYCSSTDGAIAQRVGTWLSFLLSLRVFSSKSPICLLSMLSTGLWEWQERDVKVHTHTLLTLSCSYLVCWFFLLYMNKWAIYQSREWEKEHVNTNNTHHLLERISCVPVCLFLL